MDRFRESKRMSIHKRETVTYPGVFSGFSPEKKRTIESQQVDESPNTSRLPEPSLQKEVSSLRKYEEVQQKLREKEAAHHHLVDMYDKVTKEKEGIEASLSQQIEMYRGLIKEIEEKAEERLRKIQQAFKEEMERKLAEKEEEMKVVVGEKEELETFVNELERIGDELESKLAKTVVELNKSEEALIKCENNKNVIQEKLEAFEQHSKAQIEKLYENVENLKWKVIETEREWRNKLDEAAKERERSLKDQEKQFKEELSKIEAKNEKEKNDRKEEFKQFNESFDVEKGRLNEVIQSKEKLIEDNHREAKEIAEKQNIIIRSYEQEIQSLANEKSRLFEEINSLNTENANLNILIKDIQSNSSNEKKNLEAFVLKLKEDLAHNQSNYLRERDRNVVHFEDSSKEIVVIRRELVCLQTENDRLRSEIGDSVTLRSEIRKLREMLMESSYELERIKEEYVKLVKERDYIALRINDVSYDTIVTKRNMYDRDEEAKTWREPSYSTRSRSIRR